MSSKVSFSYFNNKKIVIPQIQRDYAEGRQIGRVPEIRKSLLKTMIDVVCGKTQNTEMDFVYGYENNGCFEPLDGQQRLTTLFLLQWVITNSKSKMMVGDEPRLTYENRESSKDFCKILVQHPSKKIIKDYEDKKAINKDLTLHQYIKECGWYRWNWNYDSTVQSMLVVINDIYEMLKDSGCYDYENTSNLVKNFENIYFRFLNLSTFEMGDELYIKMNARGKELSSFDLLKSFLEQDMAKHVSDLNVRQTWQTKIDCDWMDYFWWKYYTNAPTNNRSVEQIENRYEAVIHILMWYQIVINSDAVYQSRRSKKEIAVQNIDKIVSIYKELNSDIVDYQLLMKHFDSLFHKDDIEYKDLDTFTPLFGHKLLSNCVDNHNYDDLVFLYAYIKWTTTIHSLADISPDSPDYDNIYTFLRFVKNIFELDNADNSRIDSVDDFLKAMRWINEVVDRYKTTTNSFREFIRDQINWTSGSQVLKVSIDEEKQKAGLILVDNNWKNEIEAAESNKYLNGQIYSLLYVEHADINRFHNLYTKFDSIINSDVAGQDTIKFLQLLMVFSAYNTGNDCSNKGTLMRYDQHRDYSIKHQFRTPNNLVLCAFKNMMDLWINSYEGYNFNDYYNEVKRLKANEISAFPYWRKFLIENNKWHYSLEKINESLITEIDNDVLYIRKSLIREEILICYIHGIIKQEKDLLLMDDNNGETTICFKHNDIKYKVTFNGPNNYTLDVDDRAVIANADYNAIINQLNTRCSKNCF